MALKPKPPAQKAETPATKPQASAASEENRNADQAVPKVDDQGNPINEGDANATPPTPAQPQSRDAAENQPEKPEDEEDKEAPVQDTLNGLPQSREAEENSEEAARLAAEQEAEAQRVREEEQRQAAAQKELDDKKAEEAAAAAADKALQEAAKGKTKAKAKDSMVKVKNLSSLPQRQWSTGIWIEPGAVESVKEDGWYRTNKAAKIIEDAE